MGLKIFERFSLEYALDSAYEDMHESGLDGLKKHLTENALKTVEMKMIKEEKVWKIDDIGMPKFDKFIMPETDKK